MSSVCQDWLYVQQILMDPQLDTKLFQKIITARSYGLQTRLKLYNAKKRRKSCFFFLKVMLECRCTYNWVFFVWRLLLSGPFFRTYVQQWTDFLTLLGFIRRRFLKICNFFISIRLGRLIYPGRGVSKQYIAKFS